MTTQRTGGMLAMGIMNIIYGSLGTLVAILAILVGGLFAAGGSAFEAEMGADAEGMGAMVATGGGVIMLIGLIKGIIGVMLVVAGIGVIKLASWGRTLSIFTGVGILLVNLAQLYFSGLGLITVIGLAYGGTLLALCFSQTWKSAFGGQPLPATDEYVPGPTTSFAAISSAPDRENRMPAPSAPASMPGAMGAEPNAGTPGTPGIPGMPDAIPLQSASTPEPNFGGSGMPGMPAPGSLDAGDEDVSSAA